jgi:hypothetical protein
MAGGLRKYQSGEIISEFAAKTHNRMVDATAFVEKLQGNAMRPATPPAGADVALEVEVRNNTGERILDEFAVLGLGGSAGSPADNIEHSRHPPVLDGETPKEIDHKDRFCILQRDAEDKEVVEAVFLGLTWARVDIKSGGDTTCGIVDDQIAHLDSDKSGAKILWAEKGEEEEEDDRIGVQWAVIQLGETTKPRGPGIAMITETVPAAALDPADFTATPGKSGGDVAHIMRWREDEGKTIIPLEELEEDMEEDPDSPAPAPPLVPVTRAVINLSMTEIRASQTAPVLLAGHLQEFGGVTDEEEVFEEVFVVSSVMDFRALPNFSKGTDPETDLQIPYHAGGDEDFKLDSEDCGE